MEKITTPSNKAFMMEAITPAERVLVETMQIADPLARMIGTTSPLEEIRVKAVDSICAPEEFLI